MLRRWRLRELVASWVAYWVVLLLVVAWPQIWKLVRLRLTNEHGSVQFEYSGSATAAALWLFGPPVLLGIAWIATRPRPEPAREDAEAPPPRVGEPAPDPFSGVGERESRPVPPAGA